MTDENRTTRLWIRVTDAEKNRIKERMEEAGIANISAYAREMLIDGQVIKKDFHELKNLNAQIGKIGGNINQIAKRANESRSVSTKEVDGLMKMLGQIHQLLGQEISKVLK